MCKYLSLSHIAKIHIILIKQTIFSKKLKKKGDQVSDLLCPKLTELGYYLSVFHDRVLFLNFNYHKACLSVSIISLDIETIVIDI